jgi:hypothetical protein
MGYLGYKPADKPLTAADITDSIITSAKIVDATITNSDVASSIITGQTAETSIAGGDSILIYDDSATALRKMTRTNFVSGLGGVAGITTSSTSGTALNITAGNDLEISSGKKISFLSTPPAINIDCSGTTVTIANGSYIDFVDNSGIYCFTDHSQTGQTALYIGGGGGTAVFQAYSSYTTTSGSGSFRFFYNSGTAAHRFQNNQGNTCTFGVFNIKLRNTT